MEIELLPEQVDMIKPKLKGIDMRKNCTTCCFTWILLKDALHILWQILAIGFVLCLEAIGIVLTGIVMGILPVAIFTFLGYDVASTANPELVTNYFNIEFIRAYLGAHVILGILFLAGIIIIISCDLKSLFHKFKAYMITNWQYCKNKTP